MIVSSSTATKANASNGSTGSRRCQEDAVEMESGLMPSSRFSPQTSFLRDSMGNEKGEGVVVTVAGLEEYQEGV